jgi:hypothetical protein
MSRTAWQLVRAEGTRHPVHPELTLASGQQRGTCLCISVEARDCPFELIPQLQAAPNFDFVVLVNETDDASARY